MHTDPYIPARRSTGAPDYDEQRGFWHEPARQPSVVGSIARIAAIILTCAAIVWLLGAAFLEGLGRAEARLTGCAQYRGAEAAACATEARP